MSAMVGGNGMTVNHGGPLNAGSIVTICIVVTMPVQARLVGSSNLTTPCGPNRTPYIRHAVRLHPPPTPRAVNANNRLEESQLMPHLNPLVSGRSPFDCRQRSTASVRRRNVDWVYATEKRDYVVEIVSG